MLGAVIKNIHKERLRFNAILLDNLIATIRVTFVGSKTRSVTLGKNILGRLLESYQRRFVTRSRDSHSPARDRLVVFEASKGQKARWMSKSSERYLSLNKAWNPAVPH